LGVALAKQIIVAALVFALVAAACGGGQKQGVVVSWEAPNLSATLAAEDIGFEASPVQTMVYVTNNGDRVLRNAVIRFSDAQADAPAGFGIGTITNSSTRFEGTTRVWSLGDVAPGSRVGFKIGIWFSDRYRSASPAALTLTVELASPDLASPLKSNPLSFTLAH
jgi:hypothetical protein